MAKDTVTLEAMGIGSMRDMYEYIKQLKEAQETTPVSVDGGVDMVKGWAKKDAQTVVNGEHARGRQAGIRLNHIKGFRSLTLEKKKSLYDLYVKKLIEEIAVLDGGKSYGSIPSFF